MLAVSLMFKVLILVPVWCEDDVASGDKKEPLGIPTLSNEEAPSTLSLRHRLGTDGEAECGGKRFSDIHSEVG